MVFNLDNETMWQTVIETFKWAYARRTELADPDFVNISESAIYITSYNRNNTQ